MKFTAAIAATILASSVSAHGADDLDDLSTFLANAPTATNEGAYPPEPTDPAKDAAEMARLASDSDGLPSEKEIDAMIAKAEAIAAPRTAAEAPAAEASAAADAPADSAAAAPAAGASGADAAGAGLGGLTPDQIAALISNDPAIAGAGAGAPAAGASSAPSAPAAESAAPVPGAEGAAPAVDPAVAEEPAGSSAVVPSIVTPTGVVGGNSSIAGGLWLAAAPREAVSGLAVIGMVLAYIL